MAPGFSEISSHTVNLLPVRLIDGIGFNSISQCMPHSSSIKQESGITKVKTMCAGDKHPDVDKKTPGIHLWTPGVLGGVLIYLVKWRKHNKLDDIFPVVLFFLK